MGKVQKCWINSTFLVVSKHQGAVIMHALSDKKLEIFDFRDEIFGCSLNGLVELFLLLPFKLSSQQLDKLPMNCFLSKGGCSCSLNMSTMSTTFTAWSSTPSSSPPPSAEGFAPMSTSTDPVTTHLPWTSHRHPFSISVYGNESDRSSSPVSKSY
ncbi:hypothetical protein C2S51_023083 [Perilla frutescens var. frutescens]|nr:hypothetical protein C2S51_023083 [Perilla frutescens var. frutescens]